MRIISMGDPTAVEQAVSALRHGLLIIYPTDTAYALGSDILNESALANVQALKGRAAPKPLPLIAADLAQVEAYAELTPHERLLAERFWPGPLTILVKAKQAFSPAITQGQSRIGIRVPNSTFARTLAAKFGRPVVSTSANQTGAGALYSSAAILAAFENRPDAPALFIDAGELPEIPPSTIVELLDETVVVRRPGPIKVE